MQETLASGTDFNTMCFLSCSFLTFLLAAVFHEMCVGGGAVGRLFVANISVSLEDFKSVHMKEITPPFVPRINLTRGTVQSASILTKQRRLVFVAVR